MMYRLFNGAILYLRAVLSVRNATELSDVGRAFNHFGRKCGWKLFWWRVKGGFSYLISPVSSFRYFEYPFALSSFSGNPGRCLDVSSPRLFSFYVSEKCNPASIWMINPDKEDMQMSAAIAKKMDFANIKVDCQDVDVLQGIKASFDTIWSISVIEHICGDYDDRDAIKLMYSALAMGGRLILTVPVDRQYWDEYREQAYYGLEKEKAESGNYFFQRYYDEAAIKSRLVGAIGVEPVSIRWFGERKAGTFVKYEKKWLKEGLYCTVDDPVEMSTKYTEYPSWDVMPGKGICGLVFEKPCEREVE